jgi:hypothetical protein
MGAEAVEVEVPNILRFQRQTEQAAADLMEGREGRVRKMAPQMEQEGKQEEVMQHRERLDLMAAPGA